MGWWTSSPRGRRLSRGRTEACRRRTPGRTHGLIGAFFFFSFFSPPAKKISRTFTSQQLAYASGVPGDVEERLWCGSWRSSGRTGRRASWDTEGGRDPLGRPRDADPEATARNAPGRQALADEIFPVSDASPPPPSGPLGSPTWPIISSLTPGSGFMWIRCASSTMTRALFPMVGRSP